jgi:hypothetical protein
MKAVPKTKKPSRITSAAISLPSHWNALLAAELVEADEAEVDNVVAEVVEAEVVEAEVVEAEVVEAEVVEAVRVDCELEAVDEADVDVVVADVAVTTPFRSFVNGSSACMETMYVASRKWSRKRDRILGAFQAVPNA